MDTFNSLFASQCSRLWPARWIARRSVSACRSHFHLKIALHFSVRNILWWGTTRVVLFSNVPPTRGACLRACTALLCTAEEPPTWVRTPRSSTKTRFAWQRTLASPKAAMRMAPGVVYNIAGAMNALRPLAFLSCVSPNVTLNLGWRSRCEWLDAVPCSNKIQFHCLHSTQIACACINFKCAWQIQSCRVSNSW